MDDLVHGLRAVLEILGPKKWIYRWMYRRQHPMGNYIFNCLAIILINSEDDMSEWYERKISIETRHFDMTIDALVSGDVAIHRMHDKKSFYGVTHVPTGLSFCQGLSKEDAMKLAEDILDAGVDLSELSKDVAAKKDPKYRVIAELSLKARGTPQLIKEWD